MHKRHGARRSVTFPRGEVSATFGCRALFYTLTQEPLVCRSESRPTSPEPKGANPMTDQVRSRGIARRKEAAEKFWAKGVSGTPVPTGR